MYDCVADHHDELTFSEGEVLVVLAEEDVDWWVSREVPLFFFISTQTCLDFLLWGPLPSYVENKK